MGHSLSPPPPQSFYACYGPDGKSPVRKGFDDNGVLITDPKKILQEIQNFYSNLCKLDPLSPSEDSLNSFYK